VIASLAASPRLDFGVSPNCASQIRESVINRTVANTCCTAL
jgi:hypothetical protein